MAEQKEQKKMSNSALITVVCSVVFLIVGIGIGYTLFTPGVTVVEKSTVASQVVDYINNNVVQAGTTVSLENVTEENGLLRITTSYQGSEIPVYASKDGMLLFLSDPLETSAPIDTTEETPVDTGIPKADKPSVELFVMSHCPYGTQAEKGILPVVRALGNKINFNVRFVYYAMHGKVEVDEELRQYCIKTEQSDLYLNYLACFLNASDSASCLEETGVDTDKLSTCETADDQKFNVNANYDDEASWLSGRYPLVDFDKDLNEQYGVGGSPTLVINGAQSSAGRSPASYMAAICGAFNTPPAECDTEVSTQSPGPGFGYDSTAAATAAGCGI